MSKRKDTSLAGQVATIWEQRSYLRSGISSLISVAKTDPNCPAWVGKQLAEMLDYTEEIPGREQG